MIAAIDGPALGAGAQLAVAADLRVATPHSVIGVPAAKLGLVVDHWTVRRFADEFSPPVARAMLLGAETYTGRTTPRRSAPCTGSATSTTRSPGPTNSRRSHR